MREFIKHKDKWYTTWPESVEDRAFIMWVICVICSVADTDELTETLSRCGSSARLLSLTLDIDHTVGIEGHWVHKLFFGYLAYIDN